MKMPSWNARFRAEVLRWPGALEWWLDLGGTRQGSDVDHPTSSSRWGGKNSPWGKRHATYVAIGEWILDDLGRLVWFGLDMFERYIYTIWLCRILRLFCFCTCIPVCVQELQLDLVHVRPCKYHIVTPDPSITSCVMPDVAAACFGPRFFQTGLYYFTSDRRMDARPPAGRNTSTKVQANFQNDGTATISA